MNLFMYIDVQLSGQLIATIYIILFICLSATHTCIILFYKMIASNRSTCASKLLSKWIVYFQKLRLFEALTDSVIYCTVDNWINFSNCLASIFPVCVDRFLFSGGCDGFYHIKGVSDHAKHCRKQSFFKVMYCPPVLSSPGQTQLVQTQTA